MSPLQEFDAIAHDLTLSLQPTFCTPQLSPTLLDLSIKVIDDQNALIAIDRNINPS
ncbi:hypothetical protein QUB70_24500 [Microcoleus sp. A003_D6]